MCVSRIHWGPGPFAQLVVQQPLSWHLFCLEAIGLAFASILPVLVRSNLERSGNGPRHCSAPSTSTFWPPCCYSFMVTYLRKPSVSRSCLPSCSNITEQELDLTIDHRTAPFLRSSSKPEPEPRYYAAQQYSHIPSRIITGNSSFIHNNQNTMEGVNVARRLTRLEAGEGEFPPLNPKRNSRYRRSRVPTPPAQFYLFPKLPVEIRHKI